VQTFVPNHDDYDEYEDYGDEEEKGVSSRDTARQFTPEEERRILSSLHA